MVSSSRSQHRSLSPFQPQRHYGPAYDYGSGPSAYSSFDAQKRNDYAVAASQSPQRTGSLPHIPRSQAKQHNYNLALIKNKLAGQN